jgi:hypothetical protein
LCELHDDDRYTNHTDAPSLRNAIDADRPEVVRAIEDIEIGEEMRENYGTLPWPDWFLNIQDKQVFPTIFSRSTTRLHTPNRTGHRLSIHPAVINNKVCLHNVPSSTRLRRLRPNHTRHGAARGKATCWKGDEECVLGAYTPGEEQNEREGRVGNQEE